MTKNLFPYILLLPIDSEERKFILKNIFGSALSVEILMEVNRLGTNACLVQRDIIDVLERHSNKTIIQKLKLFEKLELLKAEDREIDGRRLRCYSPTQAGKWLALLLSEVPKASIENVFEDLFRLYVDHSLHLALEQGFDLEQLHDVFHTRIGVQLIQKDIQSLKVMPEVVVFGSAAMDLLIRSEIPDTDELVLSDNIHRLPGGSAANVAVALSKLGVLTSFVGKLGGDFNSLLLIKDFLQEKVDISNLTIDIEKKTSEPVIIINSKGEKRIIAPCGKDIALSIESPEEINWNLLKSAKLLYIGDMFREMAELVSSYGHNYKKKVIYRPSTPYMCQGVASIAPILKNTDCFIMNNKGWEILHASSKGILSAPTDLLNYGCLTIIITQGVRGCTVYQHEMEFSVPTKKVAVVDEVGAGDAFAAGLIKGLLENMQLEDAVNRASTYAAHSTTAVGARSAYSPFNFIDGKSPA